MNADELEFLNNIARTWDALNRDLGVPFSVDPKLSDFTKSANALAVSINHFPEVTRAIKPKLLIQKSRSYEIINDLADSSKHRRLSKATRNCELRLGSMYERNEEGKFRFLRNIININHTQYGSMDFITCAKDAALFVANELKLEIDWNPKVLNNAGEFSNKINLHISSNNQHAWRGMQLQIVRVNESGEYEPVEMNSTVEVTLTSDL